MADLLGLQKVRIVAHKLISAVILGLGTMLIVYKHNEECVHTVFGAASPLAICDPVLESSWRHAVQDTGPRSRMFQQVSFHTLGRYCCNILWYSRPIVQGHCG